MHVFSNLILKRLLSKTTLQDKRENLSLTVCRCGKRQSQNTTSEKFSVLGVSNKSWCEMFRVVLLYSGKHG